MAKNLTDAKLDRKTVIDQVYEKIITYIKDGTWQVGEKLPSAGKGSRHF
ncbi:MAG: hypothetical protein Q4D55_00720 [Eubacteriales bacterium]|nr:hypothetical protein [Eubacteriales bacterium]